MDIEKIRIDGKRLEETIEAFADFGRTEYNGVTRLALSETDIRVRKYFQSECEGLGMTVEWDDLGNMYATLLGQDNNQPPIVMGSHLDTVEKGGRFDGVLGVITGLEVVRTLIDHNITPRIPIVVANITNEEGARFEPAIMCSGVLSGWFDKMTMFESKDKNGITFGDALQDSGFVGEKEHRLKSATAFLELHIEQGPSLENEALEIGVVEGVMGMTNYEIKVYGDSNHAGTTPMHMREDALFAANSLIMEIREKLNTLHHTLVYTIGRMDVSPNIHTVIPNEVVFTIEARHEDMETIKQVEAIIEGLPASDQKETCEVNVRKQWGRDTVWFDGNIVKLVEQSTECVGYSHKRMVSGAGHDSQFISTFIPTAMIFVPSVNGKSHAENELTSAEDCERGVNVMLQTVLQMMNK